MAQGERRRDPLRLEALRRGERRCGRSDVALSMEQRTDVVVRLGQRRMELERLAIRGERFLGSAGGRMLRGRAEQFVQGAHAAETTAAA